MIRRLKQLTFVALSACAVMAAAVAVALADDTGGASSGGAGLSTVVATTPTTTLAPTTPAETTTTPTTTTTTSTTVTNAPTTIAVPKGNPFAGRGMWIWELPLTDAGDIAAIIAKAQRYKISTVLIKSADGTTYWKQFSRALVDELHEAGIRVCAWQFVYGIHPLVEARRGAEAVKAGADCLVIDAESAYQGKYPQASQYVSALRQQIGKSFPVGLAGFPFVDFHLNFPYSVFLGPNGAQYNLPQMYWADIGDSVSFVFAHTYEYNEIYKRPIYPLGQLYNNLPASAIEEFNTLGTEFGASGESWWDWQSAKSSYFGDIDKSIAAPYGFKLSRAAATIKRNGIGDPVMWAQELLDGYGDHLAVDGGFGVNTENAVKAFQRKKDLPVTGTVDPATWNALDKLTPVSVRWVRRKTGRLYGIISRTATVSRRSADGRPTTSTTTFTEPGPTWTESVPTRNELHGEPGSGARSAKP